MKFSHNCIPNNKSAINLHKRKIFNPSVNRQIRTYNCTNKRDCPIQEKCTTENILYETETDICSKNRQKKIYFRNFRNKISNEVSDAKKLFSNKKHKNDRKLSNELWKIKTSKPVIVWKILG